jgi:hypothetical protein
MNVGTYKTLDASESYIKDTQQNKKQLKFSWTCLTILPYLNEDCGLQIISNTNKSLLTIFADDNSINKTVVFTVVVYDSNNNSSNAKTSTKVKIIDRTAPSIVLSINNKKEKLNANEEIIVNATIFTHFKNKLKSIFWSINDSSVIFSNNSLLSNDNSNKTSFNLVLLPNILPQRSLLTLTLTCITKQSFQYTSSVSIVTNGAPIKGKFSVFTFFYNDESLVTTTNTTLNEKNNKFIFFASRWIDEDLPLTFEFGYFTNNNNNVNNENIVIIQNKSEKSYSETFILINENNNLIYHVYNNSYNNISNSSNVNKNNNIVKCQVKVFDYLYAYIILLHNTILP